MFIFIYIYLNRIHRVEEWEGGPDNWDVRCSKLSLGALLGQKTLPLPI